MKQVANAAFKNSPPVLVVEDEPIFRIDVVDLIEQAGFEAVVATDVDHAIRILAERSDIRIVYMDLDMPRGVKGIEFALMIRERWPPIEIILTAAFVTENDLDLPVRAEFFPKPVERRRIVDAMNRMARDIAAP